MVKKDKIVFDRDNPDAADNIGAHVRSADGTLITHTTEGSKEALDVNIVTEEFLVWTKTVVTVPASSTVVVDNNLLADFSQITYIVNFKGNTTGLTKGFKLIVDNDGGSVSDILTNRSSGSLDIDINVTDDSIDMFFEVVNNETEDLTLTFIKSIL